MAGPASYQKNASCGSTDYNHVNLQLANYKNNRFGAAVEYPVDIFVLKEPSPGNGAGDTFHTRNGAVTLIISGEFWNGYPLNDSMDDEIKSLKNGFSEEGWTVTDLVKRPDWYYLSSSMGDKRQYDKVILVCGRAIQNEVLMEVPSRSAACYKALFERIAA